MVDTNYERLQAAAQQNFNRDLQGAVRHVTGLKRDLNGICRSMWGLEFNESGDQLLPLVSWHSFQALFGGSLTTPDHADFGGWTTLDIRWLGAVDWSPGVSTQMIGQWPAAPQQSWLASVHPNRRGRLAVSTTGSDIAGTEADAAYPFTDGVAYWVRQTIVNAAQRTATYYWAPWQDGVPTNWNQVGNPIVEAVTTPFNSTGNVAVNWGGFANTAGRARFYAAEVRNGIDGTIICNPDVRGLAPGTTSFQDGTGKTWTVNGFGAIL